ncbi:MAG: hypothetical protein ACRYGI_11410 [Janthinobacterium lividum]
MTDFADADTLSTTIDTDSGPAAAGGGVVLEPVDTSPRGDLEAVFKEEADKAPDKAEPAKDEADKDAKAEGDKADVDKPEKAVEDKPAKPRAEDGKFAPKAARAERASERDANATDEEKRAHEAQLDKRIYNAPANFLPKAKEQWRNVPREVRSEFLRMADEHASATEQSRTVNERYESVRQYDDLARSNGRDLSQSLAKLTEIEHDLQTNPVAGLNKILMEVGPRKADGQPFSLYEVAQYIAQQQPQDYQRMVAPPAQAQREDPRVAQLESRLQAAEQGRVHDAVIAPFKAQNPRFDELSNDIAMFLQSGRIPQSLSPQDRLAAAYDMAERINPPSHANDLGDGADPANGQRGAVESFSRSIKSSPGSVSETYEPEAKAGESIGESLRKEARRLNRA